MRLHNMSPKQIIMSGQTEVNFSLMHMHWHGVIVVHVGFTASLAVVRLLAPQNMVLRSTRIQYFA
jgi:hypothetical protein